MWWQRDGLEQWLNDFVHDALRRRGHNALLSGQAGDALDLIASPGKFGFSSLDMVQLASRYAACLGLDRTGLSDLLLARRSATGWCDVARRSRQIYDQQIGVWSSGSTGSPKPVQHDLNKLQSEAEFFARHLPPFKRVVSTVPSHHIYGFIWSHLLPAEAKVPRIFINPGNTLPASWAQQLEDDDLIIAIPDTWRLLKELDIALPHRFTGISSTAPLDADTAAYFRSRNAQTTLAEIYGSTETAGLGWRTVDNAGFALLPWWHLTQTLQVSSVTSSVSKETHLLQDIIEVDRSGLLHVLGRIDNVVQMAGHNVNLTTLAERISAHADIDAAKAVHELNQGNGRLHYFLALRKEPVNAAHWCMQFSRWLEQNLGDVPPPTSVVIAAGLPRGANNKVVTWDPEHFEPLVGVYRSGF